MSKKKQKSQPSFGDVKKRAEFNLLVFYVDVSLEALFQQYVVAAQQIKIHNNSSIYKVKLKYINICPDL